MMSRLFTNIILFCSVGVHPVVIAAHPHEADQIAVGVCCNDDQNVGAQIIIFYPNVLYSDGKYISNFTCVWELVV